TVGTPHAPLECLKRCGQGTPPSAFDFALVLRQAAHGNGERKQDGEARDGGAAHGSSPGAGRTTDRGGFPPGKVDASCPRPAPPNYRMRIAGMQIGAV